MKPPETTVISGPRLLPRAISGFVALLQLGSVHISLALRPSECPGSGLLLETMWMPEGSADVQDLSDLCCHL